MSLTPEQIKAMPAGPELDALAHKKLHPEDVIEWRWCTFTPGYRPLAHESRPCEGALRYKDVRWLPCIKVNGKWQPIPAYSTDGNAMLALLEKMMSEPARSIWLKVPHRHGYEFDLDDENGIDYTVWCPTPKDLPHAVAIAAALVPRGEKRMTEEQLEKLEDEFAGWEDSGTTGAIEI